MVKLGYRAKLKLWGYKQRQSKTERGGVVAFWLSSWSKAVCRGEWLESHKGKSH